MKSVRSPVHLGFVDQISSREAKARQAKLVEAANDGRAVIQSQIHFRAIAQRFLDVRLPQLGAATQEKYGIQIRQHILPAFGDLRMCDIDRAKVEEWLNAKEKAGLGWWSRTDLKGILSGIFTKADEWNLYQGANPTKGIKIGRKREVREKKLLTPENLRRLLAAVPDEVRFMLTIIFATGLRISEVFGLQWRDIDIDAGTLKVARRWHRGDVDDPKSQQSERTRQLGPLVEEFKRRYPGAHAIEKYIFVGDDGIVPPDDRDVLREILRPAAKRLGIYWPGFGWHTFRRQNVSWRQEAGATPLEAQKAAGHAKLDMTYLYTITDADREREQVERMMARLMEGEGGGGKPQ